MKTVAEAADNAREHRKPAAENNPFLKFRRPSRRTSSTCSTSGATPRKLSESLFLGIYGSPVVQAAVGIKPDAEVSPKPEMSPEHRQRLEARIAELKSQIGSGGLRECVIRGLLYVGAASGMVDERSLEALRRARAGDAGSRLTLAQFKTIVREQFFMLLLEPEASLAPSQTVAVKRSRTSRRSGLSSASVLSASAEISGETARRLDHVTQLFGLTARTAGEGILGLGLIGSWT